MGRDSRVFDMRNKILQTVTQAAQLAQAAAGAAGAAGAAAAGAGGAGAGRRTSPAFRKRDGILSWALPPSVCGNAPPAFSRRHATGGRRRRRRRRHVGTSAHYPRGAPQAGGF